MDLNEELAALYGSVLERQTQFVAIAVKHILGLYAGQEGRPQSVILVGHSMVSLVRLLFLVEHRNRSQYVSIPPIVFFTGSGNKGDFIYSLFFLI